MIKRITLKKKYEYLFVFSIFLGINISLTSCDFLNPGSYPYREEYVFEEQDESNLIKLLSEFKAKNPEYSLPNNTEFKDNYTDERKLFYSFYFRNPNNNLVIKSFVQQKKGAVVGLVAICDLNSLYNWQEVNHDLKGDENKKAKEDFETLILDKIGLKYRKRTFCENIGF